MGRRKVPSRNDAMGIGERARPARSQPAPWPVGVACPASLNGVEDLSGGLWLARRQPPHAKARALPRNCIVPAQNIPLACFTSLSYSAWVPIQNHTINAPLRRPKAR